MKLSIRDQARLQLQSFGIRFTEALPRPGEDVLRGLLDPAVVIRQLLLDAALPDPRSHWQFERIRSPFHADLGGARVEFRTWKGSLGWGSCQIVINPVTGEFYADVDRFNPTQDVYNFLGHNLWEVFVCDLVAERAWGWVKRRF